MILPILPGGLSIGLHFLEEISECSLSLSAMLPFFVPIISPKTKKHSNAYEEHFKKQLCDFLPAFSLAETHLAES
jgi:hypothetical protein